jgi:dTDP-4-amino-4,6-dideoxygalactose transaminase
VTSQFTREFFAIKDTTLSPWMLLPRPFSRLERYPFDDPSIRYHYLGRNASHALVQALGLSGQEMLFPSFFGPPVLVAPAAAGAKIRFYPVRAGIRTEVEDILAALTPETRAIYLIHYAGFPAPIREVMEIARERNLLVIEDTAHGLLSDLDGQPLGSFGHGAVFSFYKWVPVPNGAALTVRGPLAHEPRAGSQRSRTSGLALSSFSMLDHIALNGGRAGRAIRSGARGIGRRVGHAGHLSYVSTGGVRFEEDELGYAMSPISHRILRAQNFTAIARRRRDNYALLADLLRDVAPPAQGDLTPGVTPLFYATRVEDKRAVLARLAARGVEGRNFWELHHPMLPEGSYPDTDDLRRTTIELPIHQDLDADAVAAVAQAVRAVLTGRGGSAVRPSRRAA